MTAEPFTACVLQIVPELDTGGVEQTTVDISEAVVKAGGRSIVVTKGGRLEARLKKGGATVVHMPVHSKNPLTQFNNYFALCKLIRAEKVDILHVRSRAPALAGLRAAKVCGVRSVATYAGIYNAKSPLKRWYNGLMTQADMTIANSEFTRDHILSTYAVLPERVIAIPRGIDLKRFDPESFDVRRIMEMETHWGLSPEDERTRFLLAARLTRWKGQELILEAARLLRADGVDNFLLLLAGDDQGRKDYTNGLLKRMDDYGLIEHVKLVGHINDMPSAYHISHFALAPSLDPEAFGRTAVEPQAMQRPPLAASHGATVETIEDGVTGWLVPPGNAEAWAEAMKHAMTLTERQRFVMGTAGRKRVKDRFSLDVMCDRTLEVYKAMLILNAGTFAA
jgi:glycosyltransferase involved in cell wall biosynthesis